MFHSGFCKTVDGGCESLALESLLWFVGFLPLRRHTVVLLISFVLVLCD